MTGVVFQLLTQSVVLTQPKLHMPIIFQAMALAVQNALKYSPKLGAYRGKMNWS